MRNCINRKFFVLNIIVILVVCLCSGLDNVNDSAVSVIEILLCRYEEVRRRNTWLNAFSVVTYGNLYLALPLIASIPTMPLICDELRTKNSELQFCRVGIKRYVNRRYLASVLCCYATLFIAFAIFLVFSYINFPSVRDFGDSLVIGLEDLSKFEMLKRVGRHAAKMMCWGGMLAVAACNLVSITQNIYVVLCVPFLFNYILAPYFQEMKSVTFICLTLLLYIAGYHMWIWKYQGVRA